MKLRDEIQMDHIVEESMGKTYFCFTLLRDQFSPKSRLYVEILLLERSFKWLLIPSLLVLSNSDYGISTGGQFRGEKAQRFQQSQK